MAYRAGRIKPFGTYVDAIHNTPTPENTKRIFKVRETFFSRRIPAISKEPVGLKKARWTNELIRVPPKGGASGRTTRTQNAFVKTI